VRLEEESRKSEPRRQGADLRIVGVRSQIPRPDFVVQRGPEEVPQERPDLQRRRPPRDDQAQGDREIFEFSGSERVVSGRTLFFVRV
jgi:hypothetical protein